MAKKIMGIGAALMDLLIEESDEFLKHLGVEKGGMTLVEHSNIQNALSVTKSRCSVVPGGSACNTLVGIGALGGQALMVGKCGKDEMADHFKAGLERANVTSRLMESDTPTGRVLSVVTPDAQRTMNTFLGASAELTTEDITEELFEDISLIHLEGYLLFNKPVADAILDFSKKLNIPVSLDLASFQVVGILKDYLDVIIPEFVSILLANEDEARAYTGKNEKESLEVFAKMVDVAVVKAGKEGAYIAKGKERIKVNAKIVKALDTTGAGDLWASGFLYGYIHGLSLEKSALLGAEVASEVVQVMGAAIPAEGWNRIMGYLKGIQ